MTASTRVQAGARPLGGTPLLACQSLTVGVDHQALVLHVRSAAPSARCRVRPLQKMALATVNAGHTQRAKAPTKPFQKAEGCMQPYASCCELSAEVLLVLLLMNAALEDPTSPGPKTSASLPASPRSMI